VAACAYCELAKRLRGRKNQYHYAKAVQAEHRICRIHALLVKASYILSNGASLMEKYRQQHQTIGCRTTHMIGVPCIVLAVVLSLFGCMVTAAWLLVSGLCLQIIGHRVFEKNNPSILNDPMSIVWGLLFCAQEWIAFIGGWD
jgi:hypothetical protein